MPAYPLRAIVLRKTKLGETDLILTLLAEDGSQVRAVAKGARKPGSRFGARAEPYTVADMLLHTGRSLEVIAESRTVVSHEELRADLDRSTHAAVVADLLDKACVECQADERLYGLALATLDAMVSVPCDQLMAVTLAFLIKAMAMIGYRPQLDSCVACAGEPTGGRLFSLESGGVLCSACGQTETGVLPLTEDARIALGELFLARMADLPELDIPPAVQRECFALLRAFVVHHLPARLKALEYLAGQVA
jgi:DNA repair protein RecO (recombination protein O)